MHQRKISTKSRDICVDSRCHFASFLFVIFVVLEDEFGDQLLYYIYY